MGYPGENLGVCLLCLLGDIQQKRLGFSVIDPLPLIMGISGGALPSSCCCCFCCCIMFIICCCSPTNGFRLVVGINGKVMFQFGDADVAPKDEVFTTFGAVLGSCSCLYQHIAPWLALLLQLLLRKYLQMMLLGCSLFLWCISSFLSLKLFWHVLHINLCSS